MFSCDFFIYFLKLFLTKHYIKSKIHVHAKIYENIAFDMVCDEQKRKKAYVFQLCSNFLSKFISHTTERYKLSAPTVYADYHNLVFLLHSLSMLLSFSLYRLHRSGDMEASMRR